MGSARSLRLSSSLQSSLGLGHLPRLFSATMSCLLSPHVQVVTAAAGTLKVGAAFSNVQSKCEQNPTVSVEMSEKSPQNPPGSWVKYRTMCPNSKHVYPFQTMLTECVAPHMEEIGVISATASAGNPSYVCKIFR